METINDLSAVHAQFTDSLQKIDYWIRYAFRRYRPQDRREAILDCHAAMWSAWHGLILKGKNPIDIGVTGIANNAIRYVKHGRRLGNTNSGRGAMDVYTHASKTRENYVHNFDFHNGWRTALSVDCHTDPADDAAFRIDFAEWLSSLTEVKRRIAELLAEGNRPGTVARMVGMSPARVTQVRHELEANWAIFQADTPIDTVA
jgi:hypothetical protein